MAPKKVVCSCSKCSLLKYTDNEGNSFPGCLVGLSTRSDHHSRDALNTLTESAGPLTDELPQISEPAPHINKTILPSQIFQTGVGQNLIGRNLTNLGYSY
jgi:hypothetical protein